jgi:hypothetical protein
VDLEVIQIPVELVHEFKRQAEVEHGRGGAFGTPGRARRAERVVRDLTGRLLRPFRGMSS